MSSWSSLNTTAPLQFLPRVNRAQKVVANPATTRSTLSTETSVDGAHSALCSEPEWLRSRTQTKKMTATETDPQHRDARSTVRFVENAITSHTASQAIQQAPMISIAQP